MPPEGLRPAVASACAALASMHSRSALAWVNTGLSFTMDEFDLLRHELAGYLVPTADLLLVPLLHPERPNSERALNSTIAGD